MRHFIIANRDSWISSGSNRTTGLTEKDQNFGADQILEVKKVFYNKSFDYPTRALIQFPLTDLSQSIVNNDSLLGTQHAASGKVKFNLRLYEAEGTQELSTEYTLAAFPVSQSWDEGRGKFGDNPKVTDGVSWENTTNKINAPSALTWSYGDGTSFYGGSYISSSQGQSVVGRTSDVSQSFAYESPDVNMDVTDIVDRWLDGTYSNYGFLLQFSGSQETDNQTFGELKFFSSNTHTIYPPKLEVKWPDVQACTGNNTGSMTPMTSSGDVDHYVYPIGLRDSYNVNGKAKFRWGIRKRYIKKTFSESYQAVTGSYIPNGSGSYSIVDLASGETIIPFDKTGESFTKLGCENNYNYFNQWFSGFEPNRYYKILIRVKYDDGQSVIYDEDYEFKVVN